MKDREMVEILSPSSANMERPHHQPALSLPPLQDKKEGVGFEEGDGRHEEEDEEATDYDLDSSEGGDEHELVMVVVGVDSGEIMKPILHPAQPPDEDQPAKCPLPDSFLVDDGGDLKETFIESLRKIVELSSEDEEKATLQSPAQAASRKRHHQASPRHPVFCPSPRGTQYNIFQVFNQCKSFGSNI